jgi:hypothetical protein
MISGLYPVTDKIEEATDFPSPPAGEACRDIMKREAVYFFW